MFSEFLEGPSSNLITSSVSSSSKILCWLNRLSLSFWLELNFLFCSIYSFACLIANDFFSSELLLMTVISKALSLNFYVGLSVVPLISCMRKEGGQDTSESWRFGKMSGEVAFGLFRLISSKAAVSKTLRFLVCSRLNLSALSGSGLLLICFVLESRLRTR